MPESIKDELPVWERELLDKQQRDAELTDAERLALLHSVFAGTIWWERDGVRIHVTAKDGSATLARLLDQARGLR